MSLSTAEAELYALTTGIAEGMVTKHLLQELGHEVTLVNHVGGQSAKAWASRRGLERMKHVMLKYMFLQDVEEKKLTNLAYLNTKLNDVVLMTKCHTSEAHMRGYAILGSRLSGDEGENSLETEPRRRSAAKVKEQREREVK